MPVASGGTGATTLTGYLSGNGTSAVTASATIPGTAISGNISGNAANVTGIVPIANGGTGNTSGNAVNVTGTVAVANGGTGGTTSAAGLTNLLPAQTVGTTGNVLTSNGTSASWTAPATNGTVTSVTGTSPIVVATGTTTPSITLSTVPVANGGTGATTLTGYLSGNGTSAVTASTTIPGTAISGNISGNAANVTGIVPIANGGTGNASGNAVNVTGTVAVANGGTGVASLTSGSVMFGNGTGPVTTGVVPVSQGGTGLTATDAQITGADWKCGTGGTITSCVTPQNIGSLAMTLPALAANWQFDCELVVGQATALTANLWEVQMTNGATNLSVGYLMSTGIAAGDFRGGAIADQIATTSSVPIGSTWMLVGAAGTKNLAHIWGSVEGASVSGTVITIQLQAPTVADVVTIYRGSACHVY